MRHAECLVLLEAALVGAPVVTTRLGGIAEFLEDRVHELLCAPDAPEELAGAAATAQRGGRFRWEDTFARYQGV
jgi:glycosyltransferase involved in cell wall biosynthesis